MDFKWNVTITVIPTLLKGLKMTMLIAVLGILLGFAIGLLVGLARSGKNKVLYRIAGVYVAIIRGTPLMVHHGHWSELRSLYFGNCPWCDPVYRQRTV